MAAVPARDHVPHDYAGLPPEPCTARAVLATLLSEAVHLPKVTETRRRIFEDRIQRARPVVTRAIERGELPPGTDAAELIRDLAAGADPAH